MDPDDDDDGDDGDCESVAVVTDEDQDWNNWCKLMILGLPKCIHHWISWFHYGSNEDRVAWYCYDLEYDVFQGYRDVFEFERCR